MFESRKNRSRGAGGRYTPVAAGCLVILSSLILASPARAQSYAALDVPDSLLAATLQAHAGGWEKTWNELEVARLTAALAGADSAARLGALAGRLAAAEPGALGSHIARDALALSARWTRSQRRTRIRAAELETEAAAARGARDYGAADSLFAAALKRYERLGERRRAAWVMGSRGVVAFMAGDYEAAAARYREALDARQAIGDPHLVGNTLNALGTTNYVLGHYDLATRFFREAFGVREASGQLAALGSTMNYLGLAYAARGFPDSADASYRHALQLTVAQGDSARTLEVLVNHAVLLTASGAAGEAATRFERALTIARVRDDVRREALIEADLGDLLRGLGRFGEAKEHLERAVELRTRDGDLRALCFSLIGLGRVGIAMRDPDLARPPLLRAADIADTLGVPALQAAALNNLAVAADLAGDPGGASGSAMRALAVAEAAGDSGLVHDAAVTLGDVALHGGELDEAYAWRARAARAGAGLTAESHAADTLALAEVLQLDGRLDEAERLDRRALDIAREIHASDLQWASVNQLGDVEERRGRLPQALAYEREAARLLDSLRTRQQAESPAIHVFAGRVFTVEALIDLLGRAAPLYPDSGYGKEAFLWAERARARALLDQLASAGVTAAESGDAAVRPLTLPAAQQQLDPREAMAVYSLGDSSSTMWVLRTKRWKRYTLPPRDRIRARATILRRSLGRADRAESAAAVRASRALYDMLLAPAAGELKGVRHLVIVPDGVLALIPFEALLTRDPHGDHPAPSDYLIERMTVAYTPSATLRSLHRSEPPAMGPAVLVGNPDFGSSPLDRLPQTAKEVEAVSELTGEGNRVVLTGADATRAALLSVPDLDHASLLHIATHGETDPIEPERSRLWLASAAPGEVATQLTAADVSRLRLHAEQVTLSACETGLGRLERGEGVIGLARAFLAAGSRSLVVSLWRVNDASTAQLMTAFYDRVLGHGARRDEGLAEAKRLLLERNDTRSPFYWAPFILIGEAGALR